MANRSLVQDAIGVMIAMVVIAAVAIPVATDALVTYTLGVTNETISSSGSLPETITAGTVESGLVEDSETIYVNDSAGGITQLSETTNYEVLSYEDGTFNITTASEINSTDDSYLLSYDYKPTGYIESALTRTVVDYIPLALGLAVFIAAISLVAM